MSNKINHQALDSLATDLKNNLMELLIKDDLEISYKSSNDAVTSVDLAIEKALFQSLALLDPGVKVISEEKRSSVLGSQPCWIIDPLDGTSNFIQGLYPSSISMAKVLGTEILAALTLNFLNGDTYTAILGAGARLNGRPIEAGGLQINLMGSSTGYIRRQGYVPEGWNLRILGSQAIQLCHVATGVLGANTSQESRAWDDAAGALIIRESGGLYRNKYPDETWADLAQSDVELASQAVGKMYVNITEKIFGEAWK